jgi:hypothetical protein
MRKNLSLHPGLNMLIGLETEVDPSKEPKICCFYRNI